MRSIKRTERILWMLLALGIGSLTGWADPERSDGLYAEFITSIGSFLARLEFEKTPLTVCNFVGLASGTKAYAVWENKEAYLQDNFYMQHGQPADRKPLTRVKQVLLPQDKPFYQDLTFHRVVPGFVIQTGCPYSEGFGGPGYHFYDEIVADLRHDSPGILSMANSGPNTNGSQFFITLDEQPSLNGKHTVFGKVIEGMEVVRNIQVGDRLQKIIIHRIGDQAQAFKADEEHFYLLSSGRQNKTTEEIKSKIEDLLLGQPPPGADR